MAVHVMRAALLVLVCSLVGACRPQADRPGAGVPAQADTSGPRALVARWHAALVSGDKAACVACFVGTRDEQVLALALLEVVQASYALRDAVVSVYGQEGWQAIERSKAARISLLPRDPGWAATVTIARMGQAALGYLPKGRVPLHMSETNGEWRLHASGLVPPGQNAGRAADYLFRWAATLRELGDEIRRGQVKAERVTAEMDQDFKARVAPEDQPAAADVRDSFLVF
jgi:hypothetical protein